MRVTWKIAIGRAPLLGLVLLALLASASSARAETTLLDTTFVGWGQVPGVPSGNMACLALPDGTSTLDVSAAVTKPDLQSPPSSITLTIGNTDPPQLVSAPLDTRVVAHWTIDVSAGPWPVCWSLQGALPERTPFTGQDAHEFEVRLTVVAVP
jgi:hypothetical protein